MNETTATATTPELAGAAADAEAHPPGEHAHPGPAQYVGIALILAAVTAVEVGLYYIELADGVLVSLLLGLAFVKFAMVAAYFMHLKFDSRLLRRLFVTGIVLAVAVYTVALVTLDLLLG